MVAGSPAGRRWDLAIGGWIVGLPPTSGPVAAVLAAERGPEFAAQASAGSIAGVVAPRVQAARLKLARAA